MDAEEFDRYFTARYPTLVGHVTAMCGSHDDAADAVQEAFARAWARRATFGKHPDKDAWIRTVARNRLVDRWRHTRRQLTLEHDPVTTDRDPADRLSLRRAVQALPDNERHAIVLFYLVDLPVSAISAELGAPEGTVRVWLSRGRHRLGVALTETKETHHA